MGCSDGAPAMVEIVQGVTARLYNHLAELNMPTNDVIWYHCIIDQSVLCCKVLDLKNVMDVEIKIVNYIRSHALNRRQFQELLNQLKMNLVMLCIFLMVDGSAEEKHLRSFTISLKR